MTPLMSRVHLKQSASGRNTNLNRIKGYPMQTMETGQQWARISLLMSKAVSYFGTAGNSAYLDFIAQLGYLRGQKVSADTLEWAWHVAVRNGLSPCVPMWLLQAALKRGKTLDEEFIARLERALSS